MAEKPSTIAVGTYADRDAAVADYEAIRHAKTDGRFDHLAVAVVTKGADGKLTVDRHDSSAKHLAWGGAIVGAALTVIAPPAGIAVLSGGAASIAVLSGAGGIIGHLHRNIPKDKVAEMEALLESGQAGLVIVAVNPKGSDIGALLANAQKKVVTDAVPQGKDAEDDALEKAFDSVKE